MHNDGTLRYSEHSDRRQTMSDKHTTNDFAVKPDDDNRCNPDPGRQCNPGPAPAPGKDPQPRVEYLYDI